jgi:hypothetical protein
MTWNLRSQRIHFLCCSNSILDEVEYRDPVTNRRQQACAVGCEEQVSSAVDRPQQVGELRVFSWRK